MSIPINGHIIFTRRAKQTSARERHFSELKTAKKSTFLRAIPHRNWFNYSEKLWHFRSSSLFFFFLSAEDFPIHIFRVGIFYVLYVFDDAVSKPKSTASCHVNGCYNLKRDVYCCLLSMKHITALEPHGHIAIERSPHILTIKKRNMSVCAFSGQKRNVLKLNGTVILPSDFCRWYGLQIRVCSLFTGSLFVGFFIIYSRFFQLLMLLFTASIGAQQSRFHRFKSTSTSQITIHADKKKKK